MELWAYGSSQFTHHKKGSQFKVNTSPDVALRSQVRVRSVRSQFMYFVEPVHRLTGEALELFAQLVSLIGEGSPNVDEVGEPTIP